MAGVIIVGGGIAGASLAYFAAQHGMDTTLIDAGKHPASHVPSALINPVRGQNGHVVAGGLEGAMFTFNLIAELELLGYPVPHGSTGVYRPVPDEKTFLKWQNNLPPEYPHTWLHTIPPHLNLRPNWHAVLHLPVAGWVSGRILCEALILASGCKVIIDTASEWDSKKVRLGSGEVLTGTVVFCGGSYGASLAGWHGTHRRGSVLQLSQPLSPEPVSFGIYSTPHSRGGVLGSTFEAPELHCNPLGLSTMSLAWLMNKAGNTFGSLLGTVERIWTGVRFSGFVERDFYALTGYGSKGFLLAPKAAHSLAQHLSKVG